MDCNVSCALATGIIFASVLTMMGPSNEIDKLNEMIDPDTVKIYQEIKNERLKIYLIGLVLGVIIAVIMSKYVLTSNSNTVNICTFVLIAGIVQIAFYELMPKSKWMLDYLKNQEQNQQWLKIYKTMKNKWHYGFIIGVIGFIFLGKGLCN